jgi:hypothetical protein
LLVILIFAQQKEKRNVFEAKTEGRKGIERQKLRWVASAGQDVKIVGKEIGSPLPRTKKACKTSPEAQFS